MSLRLGFDVDGVFADFRSAFMETAGQTLSGRAIGRSKSGTPEFEAVSPSDAKQVWDVIVSTSNWWMNMSAYEPAQITKLYQLARRFRWEVLFVTMRVPTAGDSVQFQTQAWFESHGFYLPSVFTVPGSRGEVANALRLDLVVDDQLMNCTEVVAASQAKAVLLLREPDPALERQAVESGIGVVNTLEETIEVLLQLQEILPKKRGGPLRLPDWFRKRRAEGHVLPMNPRATKPVPPQQREKDKD